MDKREKVYFTGEERNIIQVCLDYCYHRLKKHHNSGLLKTRIKIEQVDKVRTELRGFTELEANHIVDINEMNKREKIARILWGKGFGATMEQSRIIADQILAELEAHTVDANEMVKPQEPKKIENFIDRSRLYKSEMMDLICKIMGL